MRRRHWANTRRSTAGLRLLRDQAIALGQKNPQRRQEFPDGAAVDDQPLRVSSLRRE